MTRLFLIFFGLFAIFAGVYSWHTSNHFLYSFKSFLYAWAGDTSIIFHHKTPVGEYQLHILRDNLQPGDIILTRRNGYISNLFIPGYWTHSAIYVGRLKESCQAALPADLDHINPANEYIIEALSEGITLRTLEESIMVDAFIVLRPKIKPSNVDIAIFNALEHLGKPYDFNFDFNTVDKIACTELIYHAFRHCRIIHPEKMYGRRFTTPSEIVEDFQKNHHLPGCRLCFIMQMDEKGSLKLKSEGHKK